MQIGSMLLPHGEPPGIASASDPLDRANCARHRHDIVSDRQLLDRHLATIRHDQRARAVAGRVVLRNVGMPAAVVRQMEVLAAERVSGCQLDVEDASVLIDFKDVVVEEVRTTCSSIIIDVGQVEDGTNTEAANRSGIMVAIPELQCAVAAERDVLVEGAQEAGLAAIGDQHRTGSGDVAAVGQRAAIGFQYPVVDQRTGLDGDGAAGLGFDGAAVGARATLDQQPGRMLP